MPVLRLAIPTPLRGLFDYLPPASMTAIKVASLKPGQRLRVPFGRQELVGYLISVETESSTPAEKLKPALELLDDTPLLPSTLVELCRWAAAYYYHPAGEVLTAAFAKTLRDGKPHKLLSTPGWALTTRGKGLPSGALARSPKQAHALSLLQGSATITTSALKAAGISTTILRALQDKSLAQRIEISISAQTGVARAGLTLNDEQAVALDALLPAVTDAAGVFSCHLLEGVTGSGKTEVYLQLIAACLASGKQALVLIPEIGLTPQTTARFEQRFDGNIVVMHSGLGDAERYRAWEAARSGTANIVIGTRSAIFTPLLRPGLIIIDEEHDGSYKQQDGFRYSARDVGVKRAQLEQCPILLGSATPSLETLHNALEGRYQHHHLRQRAGAGRLPVIEAVDVRRQQLQGGLCEDVLNAIDQALSARQQSLLFLNRRGFAPTLQCHDCGWIAECAHCDARLTIHRRQRRLRCHHCCAAKPLPNQCPHCHSKQLATAGLGTEQTEEYLRQRFPGKAIYRVDSDSMQGRHAMQALTDQINGGEPCILLGTQMLTKGHHFPGVSLVAVIDTDAMLFSTDFRGEERTAQLLTQVAGRAGRAQFPGKVLLQTHHPDHPAVMAATGQSYQQQAPALLAARQRAGLPPAGQLIMLRTDCHNAEIGEEFLRQLRQQCEKHLPPNTHLIGPLPAPMQRRAGRFRSQLLVQSDNRNAARQSASMLVASATQIKARAGLKWSIDIDPLDMF